MPNQELQQIKDNLKKRTAGVVHFDIQIRFDPTGDCSVNRIDDHIAGLGHTRIDTQWIELKKPDAERLLTSILHKDMADRCESMPIDLAHATTRLFLEQFSDTAKFFTNAEWHQDKGGVWSIQSWHPITDSTFDSGIVACDSQRIGMIWVEDED
jgi:ferredoxin-NADP reductase